MPVVLRTRITAIGPEVVELAQDGVVILFADGSPPELAEVAVLHAVEGGPGDDGPRVGDSISIGDMRAVITAVGSAAWANVLELGHVVLSFNGADMAERPGEICVSEVPVETLLAALAENAVISIGG